jgi:hypothetical protein
VTGQQEFPGREGRADPGDGHHADVLFPDSQRDRERAGSRVGGAGVGAQVAVPQWRERPGVAEPADEGMAEGVVVEGLGWGGRVGQAVALRPSQVDVPDPDAVSLKRLTQKTGSGHFNEVHAIPRGNTPGSDTSTAQQACPIPGAGSACRAR